MDATLRTRFLELDLATPLVLPAGVLGTSFSSLLACARCGAGLVTTKSATLAERNGHPGPVVVETPAGLLNAVGISNPGITEVLREVTVYREHTAVPVAVSVFADNPIDFAELARHVSDSPADLLELNLSCPNVSGEFGAPLAGSPDAVAAIVAAVKHTAGLPLIAKLSPNVTDIAAVGRAAEQAGADALCAINTLGPGMVIDTELGLPVLSNGSGGLSGAAIRPVAVRVVHQLAQNVDIPIIGVGGVCNAVDAAEMLIAGACLVGVGTALWAGGMELFTDIGGNLLAYLNRRRYRDPAAVPRLEPSHA